jgi:hypothetical protein
MGSLLELEARPARSEVLFELKELYDARKALVKDRTAARNRGKALTLSRLKRQNAQRLEQIELNIFGTGPPVRPTEADELGRCLQPRKSLARLDGGGASPRLLAPLESKWPHKGFSV